MSCLPTEVHQEPRHPAAADALHALSTKVPMLSCKTRGLLRDADIQVFLGCRQILSLKSEVFCSLLLSADVCEVGNQTEVPLEDCTLAEANIFLRYIYMREPVTDAYQAEGLTKVIQ